MMLCIQHKFVTQFLLANKDLLNQYYSSQKMKKVPSFETKAAQKSKYSELEVQSSKESQECFKGLSQHPQVKPATFNQRLLDVLKSKNELQYSRFDAQDGKDYSMLKQEQNQEDHAQPSQCQICLKHLINNPELFVVSCEHRFSFCQECLQTYTICRVNQFQLVTCPDSQCSRKIEQDKSFFGSLPSAIKQKYRKIDQFYSTLDDPDAKMCPKQQCEGTIKRSHTETYFMICDSCSSKFCSKCLMKAHIGHCDDSYAVFLWNKLNYKRCRQCGMFIEKNEGCNHMTCRCGYQFCYVCGEPWSMIHFEPHDQNGKVSNGQLLSYYSESSVRCWTCVISSIILVPKILMTLLLSIVLLLYLIVIVISWASCFCWVLMSQECSKTFQRLFQISWHLFTVVKSIWSV